MTVTARELGAAATGMTSASSTYRTSPIRVSVVVPTRNESGNVDPLEKRLDAALKAIEYEVVVVDDSTDAATRPALRAVCARNPRWRVIERSPREQTGLASAVVAGIDAAKGYAVCVMDGDLQHPPEIVPELLKKVESHADMAVASRYMKGGSRAGLDGTIRNLVSRSCTWLAQALFPESRRTSDPLTGFFCCRRSLISGLELKPHGFKILLEILVCAPRMRVADVPFVFAARLAGESKASTRQGVLFLKHLLSMFVYVPGSALSLKFAIVTLSGLTVFSTLLWALVNVGVAPLMAWTVSTAASAAGSMALHRLVTFRDVARQGEPDGDRLHYAAATVSAVTSLGVFALLLVPGRHHLFLAAAVAQSVGLILMLLLHRPALWSRLVRVLPVLDIESLAGRLDAQVAFWLPSEIEADEAQLEHMGGVVTREIVAAASRNRQPALFIERKSARPQPRVNIDTASAIVVPRVEASGEVSAVAVFVRRGRSPFEARHLDEAISWVGSPNRWTNAVPPSEATA